MLRRKNTRGKGPPTEAVLKHAGAGPNRCPSPRTRHRATTKTPRPASRVSSPKSPKFTDSLLEGTQFELSSRCRSSGLPQGGSGGPSCRIPAEDSWRTSAAAPSPNDIRSALAKTQHKMAPSVRLLRVPGTKGSNLSSSREEKSQTKFGFIASSLPPPPAACIRAHMGSHSTNRWAGRLSRRVAESDADGIRPSASVRNAIEDNSRD
jgi:hypothetical protein